MPNKNIDPWFKAEKVAVAAIAAARTAGDWKMLSIEIVNVSEARISRATAAHNGKRVQIVENGEGADNIKAAGRYLVQPPLVARDAALLDNALKSNGTSGVVACREPVTSLGLCPIVALGSGVTVRVQVEEPKNPNKPTCAWFDHAMKELGEHVLERLDQDATQTRQLDYLLAHFSAVPTFLGVYQAAIAICNTLSHENV